MFRRIRDWWRDLRYCNGHREANTRTWGIRPWEGAPYLWFVIDRTETARRVEADIDPPDFDPTDFEDPGYCTDCKAPFEMVRPGKSQPTCTCWPLG